MKFGKRRKIKIQLRKNSISELRGAKIICVEFVHVHVILHLFIVTLYEYEHGRYLT